jgi:glycerate-2-kinase
VEPVPQSSQTNLQFIKNVAQLASTSLRADALAILEEGYRAVDTKEVVKTNMHREGNLLIVRGNEIHLDRYDRVFFVGIGKCAPDAARAIEPLIQDKLAAGIVVDVRGVSLGKATDRIGVEALDSSGVQTAQELKKMLSGITERDLVLTVISGGGSALVCSPGDTLCETLATIVQMLTSHGATAEEIGIVRKHLSHLEGGQFAKLAYPAEVYTLIFSDVPGNDIGAIASGPTVMDVSTQEDATRILVKYQLRNFCKTPECEIMETPKEEKYFEKVRNIIVLTNLSPLRAMARKAALLGYQCEIIDARIEGEARDVGARIAREAHIPGLCLLYGGETTVTVAKKGIGGRSQEFILGAIPHLADNVVITAVASDGSDNSDKAGAIADREVLVTAHNLMLDIRKFLADNTSYEFFKTVGGHIDVGRTGSNVGDLYFTLSGVPHKTGN